MTALDRYDRLEAMGVWRRGAGHPGLDVVVKFGKSTLVIGETDDSLIAHWSLAALCRRTSDDDAAVYAPDRKTGESLTVRDPEMRAALDRVIAAAATPTVRAPARRRRWWPVLALVIVAAGLLAALPRVLADLGHALISPERAALLGTDMLPMIEARTGPRCRSAGGDRALATLEARLSVPGPVHLHVLDLGDTLLHALPGGRVLLNRTLAEAAASADEFAGWAALGLAGTGQSPAIRGLFQDGGLREGLLFLTSGTVSDTARERAVNRMLVTGARVGPASARDVARVLQAAGLPSAPLQAALAREGVPLDLPPIDGAAAALASDQDWVALQNICD